MARNSVVMLTDQGVLNFEGDSIRGDGYYGFSDGLHTVQISLNNFTGRIYIQGSLASTPGATDWFDIKLDGSNPYVEFTSDSSTTAYTLSETPTSASSVMVFVDGILQKSSTNYGISGATLTFTSAPANSAEIEVKHLGFRGVQRRSTGFVLDTFTGNGSATAFTLSNAVAVNDAFVFYNHI